MNFKLSKKCPAFLCQWLAVALLSSYTFSTGAEISVNDTENNDKIVDEVTRGAVVREAEEAGGLHTATVSGKPELYAEQWELARSGESILAIPALNELINTWLKDRSMKIEIQYPGGEEGELWVHELTDWLVSLGISSEYMIVVPGSGADDVIKFELAR